MNRPQTLFLSNKDVAATLDMNGAIDSLQAMLQELADGHAFNVPKMLGRWGEGCTLHALSSAMTERRYAGVKSWMHTPRGGGSIFSLFDSHYGHLLALLEAKTLGQLRTGGITGVATRLLAPRTAREAALIGTGAQAIMQLRAIAAVQALDTVRVYSPSAEKRRAFVDAYRQDFPFELVATSSLEAALHGAQIVTLITRAQDPFVHASHLTDCVHLNAVGAILPDKAEFNQDVFDRCHLIAVDDLENAQRGSRELRERYGEDTGNWNVTTLAALVAHPPGPPSNGMTLFKGMGMGLSDLALAIEVYERARQVGLGLTLPS